MNGQSPALPAAVSVVSLFALTSCSTHAGTDGTNAASAEAPATEPAADSVVIDACALLSATDVSALLGAPIEGRSTSADPTMPGCIWENPDNYESIAVELGNPGSAGNGTLAPPEPGFPDISRPGPDGMRFLVPGQVEFPAGGRNNMVQVAVLGMTAEESDAAAVDLARTIGPKIPR
ncbi:DUF3558 family protein [Mycobacterium sp. SMC-4]|uniref:DUF3558 family protein n=1 Tax=Mycobacterium sp. SMC-4 TaxID=2857059 RepID=UPI0021B22C5E|nr:DUF3558 family protein [Mycobacterium sp. SMC-4]UXA20339.1 hypothetical protein KXD98_12645 [Mycobacterium sp. SMC-4]